MMTAPSTMMPKSIAPRLIRLALTLVSTMPVIVISMDSGMTQAVTSAARMLPRIRNSTAMTSSRAFEQVLLDGADGGLDQMGAVVDGPGDDALGQRFGDLRRDLAATRCATARLFSPISSMAVPSTVSSPFARRRARAQVAGPPLTSATSRDPDRDAAARADDDVLDFVDVADLARRADQILLAVALDIAGADIGVVGGERRHDVAKAEPVGHQLCRGPAARGTAARSRRWC